MLQYFDAWTTLTTLERQLDGCYTRMLRIAIMLHWNQRVINILLYGELPSLSVNNVQLKSRISRQLFFQNMLLKWDIPVIWLTES